MSYQVLARKWRPRNFATLVGQEHVVRALTHALSEQRLHHAYLFTGTRGVGKTTIARILAKSLNCEAGITATPCGTCSACQEIDAGRFVDLLEVDAATNTKVDEMRQLLENAVYAPTRGRFKVYVIDEVHMLSNSAFNAMLKTLEEPPEHVKFILATTDPQKIPVTVLSRCLQFNLKQMPVAAICGHLSHILEAEGVPFDTAAVNLIARSAAGSMRDSLSLLDQAIAHGAGKVEEGQVRDMLGTVDQGYLFAVLEALTGDDAVRLVGVADDMATRSLSFAGALQDLAALLTRIQIAQCAPRAITDDEPESAKLRKIAESLSPEFVQLAYQIAIQGRDEMPMAPDEYSGFVMTLLRLHAFRPESTSEPRKTAAIPVVRPSSEIRNRPPAPRPQLPVPSSVPPDAAPAEKSGAPNVASRPSASIEDVDWHALVGQLQIGGMARELAQHCELREITGDLVILRLAPAHRHLQMKPAQDKVQQAMTEHFGRALGLKIELAAVESDTPAAAARRGRQERQDRAIAAIEQDPFVRDVIETFDASLLESSIKPIA
ncbi:MAG TPA: DNA polymerase III subunit gamma/tau [Rhodocyclaceae bacterium]|nr:DNA polymerase III subunit gamma/tau [Rhodocyclaceae bacterium]